jgi:hypothetical protein
MKTSLKKTIDNLFFSNPKLVLQIELNRFVLTSKISGGVLATLFCS